MLISIKTLKRYCKVILNVFIKKKFDVDKNLYLYDRFYVSKQNFTTEHVKIVKIPDFSTFFILPKLSNSRFFQVNKATLNVRFKTKFLAFQFIFKSFLFSFGRTELFLIYK